MPLPDKRAVLQHHTKLAAAFELKLVAADARDVHIDALARSKKASHEKLLRALPRPTPSRAARP